MEKRGKARWGIGEGYNIADRTLATVSLRVSCGGAGSAMARLGLVGLGLVRTGSARSGTVRRR